MPNANYVCAQVIDHDRSLLLNNLKKLYGQIKRNVDYQHTIKKVASALAECDQNHLNFSKSKVGRVLTPCDIKALEISAQRLDFKFNFVH